MGNIIRTNSENQDFQKLVRLLDADLADRDGEEHAFYATFNKIDMLRNVVLAYAGEEAVGCGAFKEYEHGKVEIKRMYVIPEKRGQGFALSILNELERWASELKYKQCILETGLKQPEAINLYTKAGYSRMKNYGQYENVANSVCMSKEIAR